MSTETRSVLERLKNELMAHQLGAARGLAAMRQTRNVKMACYHDGQVEAFHEAINAIDVLLSGTT